MRRRRFLEGAVVSGTALVAGCLGDDDPAVLDPLNPDLQSEHVSFPLNGDRLQSVDIPAPIHDTTISTDHFVGERETLLTFIFTRCPGPCPALTSVLATVQAYATEAGFGDEVALMPITFDPAYDTPAVFEAFCVDHGADPHAENWFALRPETPDDAVSIVQDTFGVFFEEVPIEEADDHDHSHEAHHEHETTFIHANLLLLANRDGYVERAYTPAPPPASDVIDDLERVREVYS